MPQPAIAGRTKKVETITTEDVPITGTENQGLGTSWSDYLANVAEDELAITEVKLYRVEPRTQEGYICKVFGERVDENWIQERFGGGTFNVRIWSKSGKSHLERNVKLVGSPKFVPNEVLPIAAQTPAASAPATDNAALLALLEKTIDRLDHLQAGTAHPSPAQDQVVEIMASAAKRAVEIAGNSNKTTPEHSVDADLQRLKLMRDIFQPPPRAEDEMEKAFKQAMIKKLLDPAPTANKSLIEELKGLAELRELMGWSEGAGKAEHWTTALVNGVVQRAPELLDKLAEQNATKLEVARTELRRAEVIANARRGAAAPPAPIAPVQTSANQPHPAPSTATPRPAVAPPAGPLRMTPIDGNAGNPPPAPAELVSSEPPSVTGIDTESPGIVQFVKERVVAMVQEGTPGGGIVAFLIGMRQQKFVQMLVKYTPEEISAYLRADPLLRQAVEHPDWPDVLEEARSYVQDQETAAAASPLVQ
jgi:hypothetical protein